MEISFGDNVQIISTELTKNLGLAKLVGQVYGETTPSQMNIEVIGDLEDDYAINVNIESREEALWFAPQLLRFIDHAPGKEITIGDKQFVRNEIGEWIDR